MQVIQILTCLTFTTPDGSTPPLNDGKTQHMYNSGVLRWTSDYGKASLGSKFAWVNDQVGFGSSSSLLPVELSIPRLETGAGTVPATNFGNTSAGQTGESGEQQLIIRREGGSRYVLLRRPVASPCNNQLERDVHRTELRFSRNVHLRPMFIYETPFYL
jgi:hypothetical protein